MLPFCHEIEIASLSICDQIEAEWLPLLGIVYDPKDDIIEVALEGLDPGPILITNADVPCAVPADFRALLAATPAGGIALVEALDGTTNALSISAPSLFAPVYGPDSARRSS